MGDLESIVEKVKTRSCSNFRDVKVKVIAPNLRMNETTTLRKNKEREATKATTVTEDTTGGILKG